MTPLLEKDFQPYGYKDRQIEEVETFDGEPVIRVRVDVDQAVPADELVQTLTRIHGALRLNNDERFVFLSAPGPQEDNADADEDVD